MGSSKEKTKKKVEADVEFSTPIKFFFELSHLKTPVSRPLFFSNIAPRMRKSGPPPPGQRSISAFFGARPAAVAAAGAPAAAETKVCVFRRRCGFKRKKEKPPLFSVSRALTLCPDFNALSITDTSAETHRSRREDNGPTTRARTPSRERALSDALDQDASDFRMRLPSQSPPLSRFSLSSFLRLVLRYSLTQSQAEDGPLKASAMEIEAPAKGRSGAEGTTTAATMTVSADAATRPLAPAAAAAAAAAALPPRLPKEERAARPAPKKAKKEAAAAAVPAEKAAAAAEDASEEEEEEDAPVAVGKRPRRAAAAAARKRAVVRDDDSDEEEEDGSDDDDSSSESDFSEAAAAQEETEDVSWTGGGEKREGNERGKRDERGCRRNFPASTPFSSHSLSHR